MAKTTRNRKVRAAAFLFSMCALGGIAAAKPQALFKAETVLTAHANTINGCEFEYDTTAKTAKIIGYTGNFTSLTLPTDPNHKPSDGYKYIIGEQVFKNNTKLTSVTIPGAYKVIMKDAFASSKLQNLTLEEGVEEIQFEAFYNTPVASLTIPKSLKTIGNWAFEKCSQLKTIKYAEGANCNLDGSLSLSSVGIGAFSECISLSYVQLPYNVTYIGGRAFQKCTSLKTLDLDYTHITALNQYLIYGSTNLTTIYLPRYGTLKNLWEKSLDNGSAATELSIVSYDYALAYDTTNFQIKNKMNMYRYDTDGALVSTVWGRIIGNKTKFTLYPNSALHYTLVDEGKNLTTWLSNEDVSTTIRFWNPGLEDNQNVTVLNNSVLRQWDTTSSYNLTMDTGLINSWADFVNVEIPVPGKQFDKTKAKVNPNRWGLEVTSVKCYDIKTGQELANGNRYKAGTNYYYKIQVTTKDGYSAYLPNCDYLGSNDVLDIEKVGPFVNATSITNDGYYNLSRIVSASCQKQTFEFIAVTQLQTAKATVDGTTSTPFANKNYVTSATAGTINAGHTNGTARTYTLKTITPRTVTASYNKVDVTDVFDTQDYYDIGGRGQFYGLKKVGSSDAIKWTGTRDLTKFTNLNPDTKYYLYFGIHNGDQTYSSYDYVTFQTNPLVAAKTRTVTFGDSLGLNIYATFSDRMITDGYVQAALVVDNGLTRSKTIDPAQVSLESNGTRKMTYNVHAKEMYDKVRFRPYTMSSPNPVLVNSSNVIQTAGYAEYNVADYLDWAIKKGSTAKMRNLAQATKDYGILSQRYFSNYHIDRVPATDLNAALDHADTVTPAMLEQYASVSSSATLPACITNHSIVLAFDADNTLRYQITLADGVDPNTLSCRVDGVGQTLKHKSGNVYSLEVTGIKARDLDKTHSFTIQYSANGSFNYKASGLTYCRNIINWSGATLSAKTLCQATYLYWQAAQAYSNAN